MRIKVKKLLVITLLWGRFNYSINRLLFNDPGKKFMSMFVGLVDGDGWIEIGPQKQYHKIT